MRKLGIALSALVLGSSVSLAVIGASFAGEGKDAITERQALMRLQGSAAGAIKAAIDSKDPARLKQVEGAARALAFSSRAIPTMFPRGSDSKAGETKALDKIWADPAGFKKAADTMGGLAMALADALKGGDPAAAMAAFGALGKDGCGGCHGSYQRQQ